MTFAREIMEMELNPEHKHFLKVMAAKQSVMASVFTATARVREGLLRPVDNDGLDAMLGRIKGRSNGVTAVEQGVELTAADLFG